MNKKSSMDIVGASKNEPHEINVMYDERSVL